VKDGGRELFRKMVLCIFISKNSKMKGLILDKNRRIKFFYFLKGIESNLDKFGKLFLISDE